MGLLDDAIREHLDLKRRRGADPTEIERNEREALGPVRRNHDQSADVALAQDPAGEEGLAFDHEDEDWTEAPPAPAAHEPAAPALDELDLPDHGEPWHPELEEDSVPPAPAPVGTPPAPAPPPVGTPPEPAPQLGEETAEYDVAAAEAHPGEDGEDVLEETPEFLQDTPDHDRLWFEQRPPRDFDFDG